MLDPDQCRQARLAGAFPRWVEGADVAHWSENRGAETAYLINVEVIRPRQ